MSSSLIHTLLRETCAVVLGEGNAATPGSPYAREAPLTPYEYSAAVTIELADGGRLEYLLSMPAAVIDDLATLTERSTPEISDERMSALAKRAAEVARRAIAATPDAAGAWAAPPQVVVGSDVVLACLCVGGRRICLPLETDAGLFVVEAGLAIAA